MSPRLELPDIPDESWRLPIDKLPEDVLRAIGQKLRSGLVISLHPNRHLSEGCGIEISQEDIEGIVNRIVDTFQKPEREVIGIDALTRAVKGEDVFHALTGDDWAEQRRICVAIKRALEERMQNGIRLWVNQYTADLTDIPVAAITVDVHPGDGHLIIGLLGDEGERRRYINGHPPVRKVLLQMGGMARIEWDEGIEPIESNG
jgi:hypothetical protein